MHRDEGTLLIVACVGWLAVGGTRTDLLQAQMVHQDASMPADENSDNPGLVSTVEPVPTLHLHSNSTDALPNPQFSPDHFGTQN